MSLERPSLLIGFDGLHHVGKGTQSKLLSGYYEGLGKTSVIVRGDGTREGKGETPGDPVSPEWQERSQRLKTYDRTVASWNLSSFILIRELAALLQTPDVPEVVIVDRTIISRVTFLLHRGALPTRRPATFDELYPDADEADFDVESTIPDVIFDMQASSPEALIERLSPDDKKYEFRIQNIRGGFDTARMASSHLPLSVRERVVRLNALDDIQNIHESVLAHIDGESL